MASSELTVEAALSAINRAIEAKFSRSLSDVETIVLQGAWQRQTYETIADGSGYSPSYLRRNIGPKLWKSLSEALCEPVSKPNFREAVARYCPTPASGASEPSAAVPPAVGDDVAQPAAHSAKQDWGEAVDVSAFLGREQELGHLQQQVIEERCRVMAVLGLGGIGKTALVTKFAQQVSREFEFVIWRSLRNAPSASSLLAECVEFFSNHADIQGDPKTLLDYLRRYRCLIVLDNMETLMVSGESAGLFAANYRGYGDLLQLLGEVSHQSCLLLTSREKPAEVGAAEGAALPVRTLTLQGAQEAAILLLQSKGLTGSESEKQTLCDRYSNNPLAIKIVATSVQNLFDGDIRAFLGEVDLLVFNGLQRLVGQQFERLSPLEKSIMYWLAVNREWTSILELVADIVPAVPRSDVLTALESLSWRSLVERSKGQYTQQPVVMEFVTEQLVEAIAQSLITPNAPVEEDGAAPSPLDSHALIKTTARDYVQQSQRRLILEAIAQKLQPYYRRPHLLLDPFHRALKHLRQSSILSSGYGAGNLLNLGAHMGVDFTGFDFSQLTIRHADLRATPLHWVSFDASEFDHTVFAQTFGNIICLRFSPQGRWLATGDTTSKICLWDTQTGQLAQTLKGHVGWVASLAFSADDQTLVSVGVDYSMRIWTLSTGQCDRVIKGHTSVVWDVAISPRGIIATASDDATVKLWDLQGNCIRTLTGHRGWVRSVSFSPEGERLATGSTDGTVRIWQVNNGECLQILEGGIPEGAGLDAPGPDAPDIGAMGPVWSAPFSPDGKWLAASGADKTIRLWQIATGRCLAVLQGHKDQVWSVAFSPDSRWLVSASLDHTVRLWHLNTGSCRRVLQGHRGQVFMVAVHPQGNAIASGSFDQTVKWWSPTTGQCLRTLQGYTNYVQTAAFCPEKSCLATGADDAKARLWNVETGACLSTLDGHSGGIWSVAFDPAGTRLASAGMDQSIKLWDTQSGTCLQTLSGQVGWIRAVAFSSDGRFLAGVGITPSVMVWDAKTGAFLRSLQGHQTQLWALSFQSNSCLAATGGADKVIRLWDVETGECLKILPGHDDWIYSLAFVQPSESAGKATWLVSGGADKRVKLWDTETGDCLATFEGHRGWVWGVDISPDGKKIVSSSYDRTIRVWDVSEGRCTNELREHTKPVLTVAFDRAHFNLTGQYRIASGSADETAKLWDLASATCLQTYQVKRPYEDTSITEVGGLTPAQRDELIALGAVI